MLSKYRGKPTVATPSHCFSLFELLFLLPLDALKPRQRRHHNREQVGRWYSMMCALNVVGPGHVGGGSVRRQAAYVLVFISIGLP